MPLTFVPMTALSLDRYSAVLYAAQSAELEEATAPAQELLTGQVVWT